MRRRRAVAARIFRLLLFAWSGAAFGLACNSNGTGNWGSAATWSCGRVPAAGDTATILNGHTVTLNVTTNVLASLTVNSGGALTLTGAGGADVYLGGNLTNNGIINFQASSGTNTIFLAGANITSTFSGTGTWLLDNLDLNGGGGGGPCTGACKIELSGSPNLQFNNATLFAGNSATFTFNALGNSTATVTLNAAANQTIAAIGTTYPNLVLAGTGTKTLGTAGGQTINVLGDLTIGAGVTYGGTTRNPAVNLRGNFSNGGTFNSGTGVFNFNGTAAQGLGGAVASTFTNLTISNSSAAVSANTNFNVTGTLNLSSASAVLTPAAAVVVNSAGAAGTITGSGTVQVTRIAATADYSSQYRFTTHTLSNLTVEYKGTAAQNLSARTYGDLTINNANGVTLSAGNATVNGTLNFAQGVITTGSNTVIVSSTGSVSRTSGHVNGNLQKNVATGATSRSFEIGDATTYAPVSVSFTNVTAAGNLIATTVSGEHPDVASSVINAGSDVNRYWVLTNGGLAFSGTYAAAFTYASGTPVDLDSGAVAGMFSIGQADSCNPPLSNCSWTYPSTSGASSTSATATGMTVLSAGNGTSFAIGNRKLNNFLVEAVGGGAIGTQIQDLAFNIRITARDALGVTLASFNETVNVTSNCTLSSGGGTTVAFTGGVLSPWGVTISSTGNCALTATRTSGVENGTSNTFSVTATVSSFNAVEPAADPVSGKIYTKIAGQDFALDIIALDASNAIATGFKDVVAVEIVDNSSGGACAGLPLIATFSNQTFSASEKGRHALTAPNAVANVYRNAKLRIKYPAASPAVTSCSGDNFAIRPAVLAFSVTDTNRTTAGTGRTLNNNTVAGTIVHNAGRPFTITATAYTGAGTPIVASNYDGSPTAAVTSCVPNGDACTATTGNLTVGAWSAGGGTVTTTTASYNDAGAFTLQMQDSDFATVDSGDGGGQPTIGSAAADVGRFVPDHFAVSLNTPVFATACGAGGFTYVGQAFSFGTPPVITVTAQDAANNTTIRYADTLWRISSTSLTGKAYSAASGTLDTSGITGTDPVIASTGNGQGTLTFGSGTGILFSRTTPVAPFNADISLAINVIDEDAVTYGSNPVQFGAASAGNGIAFSSGKAMRFGRLFIQNAHGSQLLDLTIPVEAQYWSGAVWQRNVSDSCTALPAGSLAKGNATGGLNAGGLSVGVWSNGAGSLTLARPVDGSQGSVDVTVNLGAAASAAACPAWTPAASASNLSHLRGLWCGAAYDRDPISKTTFGIYRSRFIFRRESY